MSSKTIFFIPELFEAILLQLPIRSILIIQRVSSHWRTTINASSLIRQTIFFDSIPDRTSKPHFNRILQQLFPQFFHPTRHIEPLNVLDKGGDFPSIYQEPWYLNEAHRAMVLRPDASWRKMYPIQPPAEIEKISQRGWCCIGWPEEEVSVIGESYQYLQDGGAKMGFLYDVAIALLDAEAQGDMFVQWHAFPTLPKLSQTDSDEGPEVDEPKKYSIRRNKETGLRNKITVHNAYYAPCSHPEFELSGLKIVDLDKEVIQELDDYGAPIDPVGGVRYGGPSTIFTRGMLPAPRSRGPGGRGRVQGR